MKTRFTLLAFVLCLAAPLAAQDTPGAAPPAQAVPARAIAAETAGQWQDAITVYLDALAQDPARGDLWVRLADVYARTNDLHSSIDALVQASRLAPNDPALAARLSHAYAASGQVRPAREAIERALHVEPDNRDYLLPHAQLCTWAGDYRAAIASYDRVLARHQDDDDATLPLARVSTWAGDTDQAVAMYRRYTAKHGPQAEVLLDWAGAESFRGNTAGALARLADYRTHFGETPRYVQELAGVLARGGRPRDAEVLLRSLDPQASDADTRATLQVLSFALQGRGRDARDGLNALRDSGRAPADAAKLAPLLESLFGASFTPGASAYSDSDGLRVTTLAPRVSVPIVPELRVDAGYERSTFNADRFDFAQPTGRMDATVEQSWGGVSTRFLPALQLDARAGQARAEGHTLTTYQLNATVRPADGVEISGSRDLGFLAITPRTLGMGLTRLTNRVGISWAVGTQYVVDAQASHQTFSDGNERWEFILSPRRSVVRSQWLNLDIGASAYDMTTLKDLANGYYDPPRYEFYAVTLFPYWKLSTNDGIGFTLAAGAQRALPFPQFQFGGNAAIDASFGIYRAWMIRVQAAATLNRRLETGAYSGVRTSVALTRRF